MTIAQFVILLRKIHDAEGWSLGASSSRETRNAFFERVVGIAHWGHPIYNLFPDARWHCKDPDGPQVGSRPPSDDVVVSMPSRTAYDCIPGAGANGYRFEASESFTLPLDQFVFVPSKPAGSGAVTPEIPQIAQPSVQPALKPRGQFYGELQEVNAFYASADGLQRPGGMVIGRDGIPTADVEALGAWGYDLMIGKTVEECKAAIRTSGEWKGKHP